MIVSEPTINELLQVAELASAFCSTEDQNMAVDEPISEAERATVQKVIAWAEALQNISAGDEVGLAMDVLNKHSVLVHQMAWSEHMEKVLTISTAHVTFETSVLLGEIPTTLNLIVFLKDEYGWWIRTSGILEYEVEGVPDELAALVRYAQKLGCDWLCLDRDAPLLDDMPQWDW